MCGIREFNCACLIVSLLLALLLNTSLSFTLACIICLVFYSWIFRIFSFFVYDIRHCFICRPSDPTVSEDAGIEPRTVATTALAVRRSTL